jgi:uncharacterized membrane protein (GlpM family)
MQLLLRFLVGGSVVLLFALLGDVVKPKSFAGLFGAAPSVAVATLALTIVFEGKADAAVESRSMVVGALAFFLYACACMRLMAKHRLRAAPATIAGLMLWLGCAVGGWLLVLR